MPLFFQQDIDGDTRLGVWKIAEEEDFFLEAVPLQRTITHPHKRLQHLAGRYLLQFLFPDFPVSLIRIADTRKPFLEDEAYHFSISHCGDYAAVVVSKSRRVGVDIEIPSDKVERIRHKFITPEEEQMLNAQLWITDSTDSGMSQMAASTSNKPQTSNLKPQTSNIKPQTSNLEHQTTTLVWSCKEAVFKWFGLGGVDFRGHIELQSVQRAGGGGYLTRILFRKGEERALELHSHFFEGVCLSWIVT